LRLGAGQTAHPKLAGLIRRRGVAVPQDLVRNVFNGCPTFFSELEAKACQTSARRKIASVEHLLPAQTLQGSWYLREMTAAASKWRLAKSIVGMRTDGLADGGISESLSDSYSAQFRIAIAAYSFDAYARMFGRDWYQHKLQVFPQPDPTLCNNVRAIENPARFFDKLSSTLANKSQKDRVSDFRSGDNTKLYDICHFVRHAFSHGRMGGYAQIVGVSMHLRDFILDGIEAHCKQVGQNIDQAA
jgi:hypothetical protein